MLIVTHRIAEMTRISRSGDGAARRPGRRRAWKRQTSTRQICLRLMAGAEAAREAAGPARNARDDGVVLKADAMKIWPRSREIRLSPASGEILGVAGLDGHGQSTSCAFSPACRARTAPGPMVASSATADFAPIDSLDDAAATRRHLMSRAIASGRASSPISPSSKICCCRCIGQNRAAAKLAIIDWTGAFGVVRVGARETVDHAWATAGDKITSLSGGNQQKVLIGRAFALIARTFSILNDPARGVDVGAKSDLYAPSARFCRRGKSVVYMSSEIEELIGFCSRVLVFRNGHVFREHWSATRSNGDTHPRGDVRADVAPPGQDTARPRAAATPSPRRPREAARMEAPDRSAAAPVDAAFRAPVSGVRETAASFPIASSKPVLFRPPLTWDDAAERRAQFRARDDRSGPAGGSSISRGLSRIGWWRIFRPMVTGLPEGASPGWTLRACRGAAIR